MAAALGSDVETEAGSVVKTPASVVGAEVTAGVGAAAASFPPQPVGTAELNALHAIGYLHPGIVVTILLVSAESNQPPVLTLLVGVGLNVGPGKVTGDFVDV